jgi:hypothetical protein
MYELLRLDSLSTTYFDASAIGLRISGALYSVFSWAQEPITIVVYSLMERMHERVAVQVAVDLGVEAAVANEKNK